MTAGWDPLIPKALLKPQHPLRFNFVTDDLDLSTVPVTVFDGKSI